MIIIILTYSILANYILPTDFISNIVVCNRIIRYQPYGIKTSENKTGGNDG